jgi:hypothetical protein
MKNAHRNLIISLFVLSAFAFMHLHAQSLGADLLNLFQARSDLTEAYLTPNKLHLEDTWNLINGMSALSLSPVTIGIIDEPVDRLHPEFAGERQGGQRYGFVNFGNSPPSAIFTSGSDHGNAVVGIIGANNILGSSGALTPTSPQMNGVMSGVTHLPYILEMRGRSGPFTAFGTAGDITDLVNAGARIINISRGSRLPFPWDPQKEKITTNAGVLFIVAAGNDGKDIDGILFRDISPAIYGSIPNVVTVGSVGNTDVRSPTSSYGDEVSISAPGENVYAPSIFTAPLDLIDYKLFSGTSFAAPFVTGVAGIIKAIRPGLSAAQLKTILTKTANTDPVLTDTDKPIGRRLNAIRAVCDPLVLNCSTPSLFVIHAASDVQFLNDNVSRGEIKANFVLLDTNNVHDGNVVANGLISVGTNNRIIGDVGYNFLELRPPGTIPTITGIITTPTPPPNIPIPVIPQFPSATTTTTITEDATLPPGTYGNLIVDNGATLTILDGVYNFGELFFLNFGTSLRFRAGSIVNVNGIFNASANVSILPTISDSPARLSLNVGEQIGFGTGNTVSVDSRTRGVLVISNDNVVTGNMHGLDIFAFFNNRINVPPLPQLRSLRSAQSTYPTSTTPPLYTLNWMETNIMTALEENNVATTTRTQITRDFQKARAVLENNP